MKNDNWKVITKEEDDVIITIKEKEKYFIAEISTHLSVPVSKLNDIMLAVDEIKENIYDGIIISFDPFNNGSLNLYCGMSEEEKEERLDSGVATLKAFKNLIELTILEESNHG